MSGLKKLLVLSFLWISTYAVAVPVYVFDMTFDEMDSKNGLFDYSVRGHGSRVSNIITDINKKADVHHVLVGTVGELEKALNGVPDGSIVNVSMIARNQKCPAPDAFLNASKRGVIVVVSAGNDGKERNIPLGFSACSSTITVGTGDSGGMANYSNYGQSVTVFAPEVNGMLGTSFSTAYVTGVISKWKEQNEMMSLSQVRTTLYKLADYDRVLKVPKMEKPLFEFTVASKN